MSSLVELFWQRTWVGDALGTKSSANYGVEAGADIAAALTPLCGSSNAIARESLWCYIR